MAGRAVVNGAVGVPKYGRGNYVYEGHRGVLYGHSTAEWLYCMTCFLEGRHKEDWARAQHEKHFRLMHKRAKRGPYQGRHRAPLPPPPSRATY